MRTILYICVSFFLMSCTVSGNIEMHRTSPAEENDTFNVLDVEDRMTARELMGLLMAYADTYRERIVEATDQVVRKTGVETDLRRTFQLVKVAYITAAMINAGHMNPEAGLLDMVTMVSLQRMVWEKAAEYGAAGVSKEDAARLVLSLRKLEQDAWDLAARIMTKKQLNDLKQLILDWRAENPEQSYVSFVRFQDFAASSMKDSFDEIVVRGGLLASVNDATRELHETRLLAERSLFFLKRMPLLTQYHGHLFMYEALALPETKDAMLKLDRVLETYERTQKTLEDLPEEAGKIRESLLNDAASKIAQERTAAIHDVDDLMNRQRNAVFSLLESQYGEIGTIMAQVAETAKAMQESTQSLLAMVGPKKPTAPGEPTALEKVSGIMDRVVLVSGEMTRMTAALEQLDEEKAIKIINTANNLIANQEQRLFFDGVKLLFIAFTLFVVIPFFLYLAVRRKK